MERTAPLLALGGLAALVALNAPGCGSDEPALLNVSYDPTRELWRDLNVAFQAKHQAETGRWVRIAMSHGGSSSQARAVIDGLPADVVTLALWTDTEAVRKKNMIRPGWEDRLPNRSLPYHSTVVFLVRKGNPKGVRDWPDLGRPGVGVVTPNPKTSGNGRLSFLAAWGAVKQAGGTDADAEATVAALYRNTPVLDTGARGSTTTFVRKRMGDVLIGWENEALAEVARAPDELEVVYPPRSLKAEPFVAVVDDVVDYKKTREIAEAYLRFLYTPEAQELIARNHYRPADPAALARHADTLRPLELFGITDVTPGGWPEAQERFFAEGGAFDRIYRRP